ncbi:MAG TPA: DUF3592 domain-containing protein [Candidatus Acidoferrum sp.]
MAFPEELVAWLTGNREKILRYAWIPQVFAGLVFLGLSYLMGHAHFHLIREGVRTAGRIVAYKQERFRRSSGSSSTSFMPMVEFHTHDRFIQFEDWLGSNSAGALSNPVIVLYDPANPSLAMIDRPVWNWLPWAPHLRSRSFPRSRRHQRRLARSPLNPNDASVVAGLRPVIFR